MNNAALVNTVEPHKPAILPMKNVEALLFDAGDILYHRPERAERLAAFLSRHANGNRVSKSAVNHLKLLSWRGALPRKDYYRALLGSAGIVNSEVLNEGAEKLVAEQHDIAFFPGVASTLHSLRRAGYRLGIITNTHETTAEKLDWFARIGIDGLWDVFVNSCETGVIKPEPEIYKLACTSLGLPPESCVFIGHSAKEIEGARGIGLRTISCNPDTANIGADLKAENIGALAKRVSPGPEAAERAGLPLTGPGGFPTIAAHRGGALLWPENSLTAFRGAMGLNVDLIEADTHLSSDGQPIILHDPTLDRTTDGTGELAAFSAQQLATVHIKGTQNETVFTLDDLLSEVAPSQTDLRLELKVRFDRKPYEGLEAAAIASLERFSMLKRTTISSFYPELLLNFQKLSEPAGLIALVRTATLNSEGAENICKRLAAQGISEIAFSCLNIDQELIALTRKAGLRMGAFSVRTAEECDRMLTLGITTFTTDRPDYALQRRRALMALAAQNLTDRQARG